MFGRDVTAASSFSEQGLVFEYMFEYDGRMNNASEPAFLNPEFGDREFTGPDFQAGKLQADNFRARIRRALARQALIGPAPRPADGPAVASRGPASSKP